MKPVNRSFVFPFVLATFVVTIFSSCEKVIDLDLDQVEKKYVIEAILTDHPGGCNVFISQTKDFTEDNNFPGVSGAVVTINEEGGATTPLPAAAAGRYTAPGLTGITGKKYTLSVTVAGQVFTASATMPKRINLDTIYVTDEVLFTDAEKTVNTEYKDPAGRGNNYRFIQYVNTNKTDQIFIMNDEYTDGRNINSKLYFFTDEDAEKIKSGDKITIEMQCIDPVLYKYWFSLIRSATGESGQATPSNPVSNMQGGALGYFSTHTSQVKELIVP